MTSEAPARPTGPRPTGPRRALEVAVTGGRLILADHADHGDHGEEGGEVADALVARLRRLGVWCRRRSSSPCG